MRIIWSLCLALSLAACGSRDYTPTRPDALDVGTPWTIFAATTRAQEPDGAFGYGRSSTLTFLELTVSIPPNHTPGTLEFGYAHPDPETEFTMAARETFSSGSAFRARLSQARRSGPNAGPEVNVFVHGYNATQAETAFRAAQIARDLGIPGTTVIYSWPSQGRALGYVYDNDSMLFARDGLEELLRSLASAGFGRINLIAHSLGSALAVESLRQMDLRTPGWPARHLNGVLLMSPDIDVDVFRSQMTAMSSIPEPFVVLVSRKDAALNISARLRGDGRRERLGTLADVDSVADLPVQIVDLTAFSNDAESSHFVAASSPALIAMLSDVQLMNSTFVPETRSAVLASLSSSATQVESATRFLLAPAGER